MERVKSFAAAEQGAASVPEAAASEPSALKMLQALMLCLAVFFILVAGMKRLQRREGRSDNGGIAILSRTPLSPKVTLMSVRYKQSELLIAVGNEGATLIHEMATPEGFTKELQEACGNE